MVVEIDAWPSSFCTTSAGTSRFNNSVAYVCRNRCGVKSIPVRGRSRATRSITLAYVIGAPIGSAQRFTKT